MTDDDEKMTRLIRKSRFELSQKASCYNYFHQVLISPIRSFNSVGIEAALQLVCRGPMNILCRQSFRFIWNFGSFVSAAKLGFFSTSTHSPGGEKA